MVKCLQFLRGHGKMESEVYLGTRILGYQHPTTTHWMPSSLFLLPMNSANKPTPFPSQMAGEISFCDSMHHGLY